MFSSSFMRSLVKSFYKMLSNTLGDCLDIIFISSEFSLLFSFVQVWGNRRNAFCEVNDLLVLTWRENKGFCENRWREIRKIWDFFFLWFRSAMSGGENVFLSQFFLHQAGRLDKIKPFSTSVTFISLAPGNTAGTIRIEKCCFILV